MRKIELSEIEILRLKMEFEKQKDKLQRWVYFNSPTRVVYPSGFSYILEGYHYLQLSLIEQLGGSGKWADAPFLFYKDYPFSEDGITVRLYQKDRIYLIRKDSTEFLKREGIGEAVEVVGNGFDENYLAVLTPPPYKSDRLTPQEIETIARNLEKLTENFENPEMGIQWAWKLF